MRSPPLRPDLDPPSALDAAIGYAALCLVMLGFLLWDLLFR